MTHKVLDQCDSPLHLLLVDCNSSERHIKDGMRLRWTTHHKCCQLKQLKAAHFKNHEKTKMTRNTMMLNLCNFPRERKPGWLQNAKTLLLGTRNLLPLTSTCRCSRTNEWNSAFADSIFDHLTQPCSSRPCSSCPKRWQVEFSSPPIMILGQKQLRPCQTDERSATVERMELTKSSRKGRRSLRNSLSRKLLFILSRDDSRRVFYR